MTPAQQTALEGLVGRPLNAEEIAAIDQLLPDRNDAGIAAILSVGRTRAQPTPIGIGTVLAVMAPSGGDFLNGLEELGATDANVKWSLEMIRQATFDIGHPVTRAQLQQFAQDQPAMAPAIAALLTLAEVENPLDYNAVSDALNSIGGA